MCHQGPSEHTIRIENLSSSEIWIPLQDSFVYRFAAKGPLHHGFVEKGAGKPTDIGTHEVTVNSGYNWTGRSSTYAKNEDEREIIPWSLVERDDALARWLVRRGSNSADAPASPWRVTPQLSTAWPA